MLESVQVKQALEGRGGGGRGVKRREGRGGGGEEEGKGRKKRERQGRGTKWRKKYCVNICCSRRLASLVKHKIGKNRGAGVPPSWSAVLRFS